MQTKSHVSRRTVVATGVAAAWSIPLIQLATATPALAVSGKPQPPDLSSISGSGKWSGTSDSPNPLTLSFTLQNGGGSATTGLQVTYQFPASWAPEAPKSVTDSNGFVWALSGGSTGSKGLYTFVASAQLASHSSVSVSVTFIAHEHKGNNVNVTIAATATNSGATNGSVQVQVKKA